MLVLTCNNISKSFGSNQILRDINFSVHSKDKIGLVGPNGSGKTTLFNILNESLHPDTGEVFIRKDHELGYLAQHTKISSDLNIFEECLEVFTDLIEMEENLRKLELEISDLGSQPSETLNRLMEEYSQLSEEFTEKNGYGYQSSIRGVLIGLGFDEEEFYKPIQVLSGGEKSRVSLAKLLLENPDILLLDEPTNHLDIEAINWLSKFIRDYQGAVILISHDRYFLDEVVNRIFHLTNKSIDNYNTDYTNFIRRRKEKIEVYKKHYESQQQEIKRQEEIIERYRTYGGERYNRLAKSREKMLNKIEVMEELKDQHKMRFTFKPKLESGNDVLEIKDLAKSFNENPLFENLGFNIYKGERVGLIGPNGVGKSSLFKMILGQIQDYSGDIKLGHKVNIGYFDQEMESLDFNNTVMDEIWDDNPSLNYYEIRTILSQFMFIGDDIFKEVSNLSGGEKGRLSLLKLILSEANFLLMDEPTNHLDIDSKEVLEDALLDYEGTLLVISHDRYFLNRVVDKIILMEADGITEFLGNYDYYVEKTKAPEEEEVIGSKTKTQIQKEQREIRQVRNEKRKLRKELDGLEKSIKELENKIQGLDEILCDPNIYSDTDRVFEITRDREEAKKELDLLYDSWLSLEES